MSTTQKIVIQKGALWLLITILIMSVPFAAYANAETTSSLYSDHTITVYGSSSVLIYDNASESQFAAILRSPSGEKNNELVWSVDGLPGVSITQTGLLQVDPSTREGTAVITVTMKEDPSVVGTRSVSLVYHDSKTVTDEPESTEPTPTEPTPTEPTPVVETDVTHKANALVDHLTREVPKRTSHVRDAYVPKHNVSRTIANYVLSWQMDYEGLGGWSKNFDDRIYTRNWNGSESKSYTFTQGNTVPTSSIDNDATIPEIQYLAAVYGKYGGDAYKNAVRKATDMILHMQHEEGSWGEMYPEQTWGPSSFENRGTILQMVHYHVMSMYQKILTNTYPFNNDIFDAAYKQEIQKSYDKALDFLIKSQVEQNGVLTGWAGKYDESSYKPIWARSFEPPAINTFDTGMLLFHLISIPDKSEEVVNAIYHAAMFMHDTAMVDMRYTHNSSPYFVSAPGRTVWYKYLEFGTNRGIVAENRNIFYSVSDLSAERISGYGWGSDRGYQFYEETAKFLANYQPPVTEPEPVEPEPEPVEPEPEPEPVEPEPEPEPVEPEPEPEPVEPEPEQEPLEPEPEQGYEDYTVTVYGSKSMQIYNTEARSQFSAVTRNKSGEVNEELIWKVSGVDGVSITQNGLLRIDPSAKEGTAIITVTMKEAPSVVGTYSVSLTYHSSKTIVNEPVEEVSKYDGYTLTIYASKTTKIYPNEARTQYAAVLRGDGKEITGEELLWSVSGDANVSID